MRNLFLGLVVLLALTAAAAGQVRADDPGRPQGPSARSGQSSSERACLRLARWCARYRTGAVEILLEEQYRRYAHSRTSFLTARSTGSGRARSARSGRAGVTAVVDRHRRYARGEIDARALARFLTGHDGGRRVATLAGYAELLAVLHGAATTPGTEASEARAAELLLGLAGFAFGGSRSAEADRWGVHRRRAPILVRREARRHLRVLAARSAAARRLLLAVVRGERRLPRAALEPREIAIRSLPERCTDASEVYVVSRVLAEVLVRRDAPWIQLAAARLLAALSSTYHAHLTAKSLRAATTRVRDGTGSPGAVVAHALVEAARAELTRAHREKHLDAPWDRVPGGLHTLVETLIAVVRDRKLPLTLRRNALAALEAAPHWGVVHALAIATAEDDAGELAGEVFSMVRRVTAFQGPDAAAWRRWHARHHAEKDGAIPPPSYADDRSQSRFYGIPLAGERILFVIDVSGSMADPLERGRGRPPTRGARSAPSRQSAKFSKIGRTRAELIAAIERLDDRRRFDVLVFADAPTRLWGVLVPASEPQRKDAVNRARSLGGSGWTDLGTAILTAFGRAKLGQPRPTPRPRRLARGLPGESKGRTRSTDARTELPDQIILLSDGMPTKGPLYVPDDILDEVSRLNRALRARVDAVALGEESDPFFLERLARENGGELRVYPRSTAAAYEKLKR